MPQHQDTDGWFLLNVQQYGYYRVNYDRHNWNALINQLNKSHAVCGGNDCVVCVCVVCVCVCALVLCFLISYVLQFGETSTLKECIIIIMTTK